MFVVFIIALRLLPLVLQSTNMTVQPLAILNAQASYQSGFVHSVDVL